MKIASSLVAGLMAATVIVAQNPIREAYHFGPPGGADAQATLAYTESGGNPSVELQMTSSDTVEYVFGVSTLDVTNNTIVFEGTTADAFETTLTVADPTADSTFTLPDAAAVTGAEITVGTCTGSLVTGSVDVIVFLATRAYTILDIDAVWQVAEAGGTIAIMPERLQGTEDVSAGDDLLTAAFDATGTANTVVNGTLSSTVSLAIGDRIGLDFTNDTAGELLNVCVNIRLIPA